MSMTTLGCFMTRQWSPPLWPLQQAPRIFLLPLTIFDNINKENYLYLGFFISNNILECYQKEVENNYGYTGSYKEMNCLTAYGEYKSKLKETEASEDKPDAVKCAYDKYKYKSNDDEQDRMRKSASHKGIIADFL